MKAGPPSWNGGYPRRCRTIAALACAFAGYQAAAWAGAQREDTLIVFNKKASASEAIARHYSLKRAISPELVLGVDLPTTEALSRDEYRFGLEDVVSAALQESHRLEYLKEPIALGQPGGPTAVRAGSAVRRATIRHIVLCYGVPVRIVESPSLKEAGLEKLRPELNRNEASVDTELATLPDRPLNVPLTGPLKNPVYGSTNAASIGPERGVFIVARLDGPSPSVVTNMIDKALEAERFGLSGRAYFDSRGIQEGGYKLGDEWIRKSARIARETGWETALDERPETFGSEYVMSDIALYAGWYDGQVSGPFTLPDVDFAPGAIAYHLHSFSAATVRSTTQNWVGPLLAKGATATLGCVAEPYLETTPDLGVLFSRLLVMGFSFGEAAYASLPALSWQITILGDPLYRPLPRSYQTLHQEMLAAHSRQLEWSVLRLVNLNLQTGMTVAAVIDFLEKLEAAKQSSVLQEKLAELYLRHGRVFDVIKAQSLALQLAGSKQAKARILLSLAPRLALYEQESDALAAYRHFLEMFPDHPQTKSVRKEVQALAKRLGRESELSPAKAR